VVVVVAAVLTDQQRHLPLGVLEVEVLVKVLEVWLE
tara:strand:- start:11 stop:118 length:108 start_codon:yes stop_codon:yes gene_type:complete